MSRQSRLSRLASRLLPVIVAAFTLAATITASAQLVPGTQSSITAAFTPGKALPLVLDTIRSARETIFVAAYSFTSKPVATALRDASRRGVKVFVVADATEAGKGYSAVRFLANERMSVRINGRYAVQHNKFMVVDGSTVQTGSFNYTSSAAERNAENVLVIRNAPAIAAQYDAEWRRLWNEGTEVTSSF